MVQAAATGIFDFAGHDPFDSWWWQRLRWALNELVRRNNLEYHSRTQQHRLAYSLQVTQLFLAGKIELPDWEAAQAKNTELLDRIYQTLFPWTHDASQKLDRKEASQLEALWEEAFGDQDDPAVREMLAAGVAHMQKMAES